ncbi:MAG: hypothetical protein Q9209_002784 [Squamulea sp. 1 TL-2023]
MPTKLASSLLTVDTGKMHHVDTRNAENLYSMWADVPDLSASVDSISSDEDEQNETQGSSHTAPMDIQLPRICDPESRSEPSKGRERHISSLKLERMVVSIKEKQKIAPLSPSIIDAVPQVFPSIEAAAIPSSPTVNAPIDSSGSSASTAPLSGSDSDSMKHRTASDTSAELLASHSIVRGFSPGHVSSSYRSTSHLAPSPIPAKTSPHSKKEETRLSGMFLLGGSSGEDDSSFEDQMLSQPKHSALAAGLKRPLHHNRKQTSFKDQMEPKTINNRSYEDADVFESDDEEEDPDTASKEDEVVETDDDESDWEDSISETAEGPTTEKHLFQRVDSRPHLVSQRSLLTTLMNQPDRAAAFANMASKSTSALRRSRRSTPSAPSSGTSPEADTSLGLRGTHVTPAKPIIMTTSNTHPPALSPRSTRRNMLAQELTESLRKHLLWERQQKSTTANAFLKRRHTAHDMANLQDYPGLKTELNARGGCRAGDHCPFYHDPSRLEQSQHGSGAPGGSDPRLSSRHPHFDPVRNQPPATGLDRATPGQQHGQRYQPPQVDPSRVVQKPITRLQKEDPRQFQIGQLERRFATTQKIENGRSTLTFQLTPSDPDFPFELTGLECVLHVPDRYPQDGRPSLAVRNRDMPRGYQINVERGFGALAQASLHATLLSLVNALDRQLEALLTGPKAETIKIVSNIPKLHVQQPSHPPRATKTPKETQTIEDTKTVKPQFTPDELRDAEAKREAETRQLEARLGRLPTFAKSSDGIVFTVPISPRKPGDLPVPLQALRSVKLLVPLLYPLHPCRIEIPGINKEMATKTENGFNARAQNNKESSLMAHINYFAQHMHTMVIEAKVEAPDPDPDRILVDRLRLEGIEVQDQKAAEPEDDRSHIKIIPRPPEWAMGSDEDTDSDEDSSDPYDSGDDSEDAGSQDGHEDKQAQASASEDQPTAVVERGVSLNFPSLELHSIELLELASLSISIKCTRCKTSSDMTNLRSSSPQDSSCPKCAQPCSVAFRSEPMHINSVRAGYLDLSGCTITDMLPSTFIPTCSTCSTTVPAPGIVSVRGDAASIAICRECHNRLTFKIPETKFTLVSNTSLHPRHLLPLRRKPPKETLGIVAGQELPRRGRCRHYAKSYRWFRFSCCAKVYACDKCHDEKEAHPNEHANRMICGHCSREQNYRPEDCGICRGVVVGKKGSGFWEGGKGTRDKSRMSRKDPRKYKRRGGTRVGGPNKGGIGGGGETAKKS